MKKVGFSVLAAIACLVSVPHASGEKPAPESVVLKVLDVPLPGEEKVRWMFLWNAFANKPEEERFETYTTDSWKDNFSVFAKALIQKAKAQKLDSESLRKVLDLVLKHSEGKTAYLPVGAYQTTLDGKLVWIITVKWETPSNGEADKLSHIRIFAFTQKTLKQVAFCTCM